MLKVLDTIVRKTVLLTSVAVLLWSFLVLAPSGITTGRARAISECDKIAVDKGSILTDNEACANPCDTTAVTPLATTPNTPGSVFILGDSIGVGLNGTLGGALGTGWSVSADAKVGRPLKEGVSIANNGPAGLKSAQFILVVLGTNNLTNGSNEADISAMMSALKAQNGSAKIYWLKTNVTRSDLKDKTAPYNQLVQAGGATTIDNTVAISSDGIHPADYSQLAGNVAQVLKSGGTPANQTSTPSSSAQDLAKQMLSTPNITYWTNNSINTRDIVVALSEGKKAYTTASNATNKEADINVNILKFILEVGKSHKIMVNALTDKTHSNGSNHYKGLAVDLDNNGQNSPPTSVLDPIAAKFGGTRNSEVTHWHYDFTSNIDASVTPTETKQTASCCVTTTTQTTGSSTGTKNLQEFIDKYGEMAFNTGKKYGIPYEAIIAQGALESAYGGSGLTKEANNFFGIKAGSSWHGPIWTGGTSEQTTGGESYNITASFRAYPNAQAGFDGYGEFITSNSRYKASLNYPGDPVQYITEIRKAGYATDVTYVDKLTRIINQVTTYVKSKGSFPPSSEVKPDASPPSGVPGASGTGANVDCNGLIAQTPSSGDGSVESNKQIAKSLLAQKGLPDSEWQCLDKLWTRESGWKQDAKNPSSSAYGIPQALASRPGGEPGDKMASAGADWKTNPLTQITWGLSYIEERYHTPCGAWAHSEDVGWY